jgi:hypothetical protein
MALQPCDGDVGVRLQRVAHRLFGFRIFAIRGIGGSQRQTGLERAKAGIE